MSAFNELGEVWSRVRKERTAVDEILTGFKSHNYFQPLHVGTSPRCY